MFYVAIGAAVVHNFATDYSVPITRHSLYGPFLQELILLGDIAVRLLKGFADVIQLICLQVLYAGTVEKCYAVGVSVSG